MADINELVCESFISPYRQFIKDHQYGITYGAALGASALGAHHKLINHDKPDMDAHYIPHTMLAGAALGLGTSMLHKYLGDKYKEKYKNLPIIRQIGKV